MNRKLITFVVVIGLIWSISGESQTELYVTLNDGSTSVYNLDDIDFIDFELPPDFVPEDLEKFNEIVKSFKLLSNYPNPFNPRTAIEYELQNPGNVEIKIFDVQGKEVKTLTDSPQNTGKHFVYWDATDSKGHRVVAGSYFYQIKFNDQVKTKQMLLLK